MLTVSSFALAVFVILGCVWFACVKIATGLKASLCSIMKTVKWIATTSTELDAILQQIVERQL